MRISKRILVGALFAITGIVTIGAFEWYLAYWNTRDLEMQASKAIVAWVFEDQPIPGFEEVIQAPDIGERKYSRYVGSASMCKADRWYVSCDFLPQDISLSDNPRIERISREKAKEILDQEPAGSEKSSFLWIHLRSASRNQVELAMLAAYGGGVGGAMYEFTFTRVDVQLNGTGRYAGGP